MTTSLPVHARAPLRLGLAGGGIDVVPYSELYSGHVLNATISLFTHCHVDRQVSLPLRDRETLTEPLMLHRAVYAGIVRNYLGRAVAPALRLTTYSDAPVGSGVASSSALVVAMVGAHAELFQLALGEYDLAYLAFDIERNDCALVGGRQYQYAAAFCGFNFMEFGANGHVVVYPLRLKRELADDLESHLLVYHTGCPRDSAEIIEKQISGAGGGGFMMIAVVPARRFEVVRALEPLGVRFFPFTFVEREVQPWKSR